MSENELDESTLTLKTKLIHIFNDRRFLAFLGALLIGLVIKFIVLSWSIQIVIFFETLFSVRTHGLLLNIGDHLILEHFDDWTWYYEVFVERFLQGYPLYTPQNYEMIPGYQTYIYPPLFLYWILIFSVFPGEFSLVAGIVFFDIITASCLFIIAYRVTHSTSRAFIAALVYYLNPIALWWTDFLWFGEACYTAMLILGFLFLLEDHFLYASLFMGLAVMTKQVAIVFVPILLILTILKKKETFVYSVVILLGIFLLFSMPYLILMPNDYLYFITSGAGAFLYLNEMPPFNSPVQLFASFWFLPAAFRNVIAIAVYSFVPLVVTLGLVYAGTLYFADLKSENRRYLLVNIGLFTSLGFLTFFPRGIFKWYLVGLIPFFTLAMVCIPGEINKRTSSWIAPKKWSSKVFGVLDLRMNIGIVIFWLVSLALTLTHRWLGPGILFLCLIAFSLYWFFIGRKSSFSIPVLD